MRRVSLAAVLFPMVCVGLSFSMRLVAQAPHHIGGQSHGHVRFVVKDLGTFGGPFSGVNDDSVTLNNSGVVAGGADTTAPDPECFDGLFCFVEHAFRWQGGKLTDLGTLPYGANSFGIAINSQGTIAGISENGLVDSGTGSSAFHAVLWHGTHIIDLETFGGSFSLPNDINDFGQVVGGAQNLTPDPFNFGDIVFLPSSTQWRATLWQDGNMIDLGSLGKGQDSFAEFINEQGQIAGDAFTNSVVNPATGYPTVAPFLWQKSKMRNLGTLGGHRGVVIALNNLGQVTGWSNVAGDLTHHAFLWDHNAIKDLGTLGGSLSEPGWLSETGVVVGGSYTEGDETFRPFVWKNGIMTNLGSLEGDPCSFATGVNSKGQVIGDSVSDCFEAFRPFLWEGSGAIVDLNDLIPPHPGFHLRKADFINELGEIAAHADYSNGDRHAVLLIPCELVWESSCDSDNGSRAGDAAESAVLPHVAANPEAVRRYVESLRSGMARRRFFLNRAAH